MPDGVWSIQLLGRFQVFAPDGTEIEIRLRKCRALLALLALNDGLAISRETLGSYLWPDKDLRARQQNLRRAIKDLREAFSPLGVLEANRENCRIAIQDYRCDALECLLSSRSPGPVALLPEMTEPVFDGFRDELEALGPSGALREAVDGAASVLAWLQGSDPDRILDFLYSCRNLAPAMPPALIEESVRTGLTYKHRDPEQVAWAQAQLASALTWMGRLEEAIQVAKTGLGGSDPIANPRSWTSAAHDAAMILVWRGRFDAARRLLDTALSMAERAKLRDGVNRLRHARALGDYYEGKFEEALACLERLEPNPFILLHRAGIWGILGQADRARRDFAAAESLAPEERNIGLESQFRGMEGYLLLSEKRPDEARDQFLNLVALAEAHGLRLIQVHALEGLALAENDPTNRRVWMRRALELRSRYRLALLPGDRRRLASLSLPEEGTG